MGKRGITQARGAGGPRYRAPSHRYFGAISYAKLAKGTLKGEVMDIVDSVGHTAPLMVVLYEDGSQALFPAPHGIKKGDQIYSGYESPVQLGNVLPLRNIPTGIPIFNIERYPQDGGALIRTSGGFAIVVTKEGNEAIVRLPSKKTITLNADCRATIGTIAGHGRTEKPWVKGGKHMIARHARGKMHPTVSAVAKNSIDHKFGGSHRRSLGVPTTTSRNAPPGRKVGLIAARRTGRGK